MQDKEASAFIIATANDVSQLPPELLRKGRFDEIFFCALPEEKEREDIFKIHLEKRGYKGKDFNTSSFAAKTRNYSGAEIEQIIKQSILFAFNSKEKKMRDEHVLRAIKDIIPLYETCKQDIDWLLAWVGWDEERQEGLRARFASDSKQNHADEGAVADTEGGKKVIIKLKPDAKGDKKDDKDGKGKNK
jgi:SpoVK/Ycf46/Vps4 family AAA+-type ATPase